MLAVIVPADENILLKEFDKLSNYKDFEIEVTKMYIYIYIYIYIYMIVVQFSTIQSAQLVELTCKR